MYNSVTTKYEGIASAVPVAIVGMGRMISLIGLLRLTKRQAVGYLARLLLHPSCGTSLNQGNLRSPPFRKADSP